MRVFSYKDAGTFGHSYTIVQDSRGIIYAANEFGLLQFDGANWTLHRHPDHLYLVTIGSAGSGLLYTGFFGEYGYVDLNGPRPEFISLSKGIPDALLNTLAPWRIYDTPLGLMYWAVQGLVFLDPSDSTSLKNPYCIDAMVKGGFSSSAFLGDRFLILQKKVGMQEFRGTGSPLKLLDTTYTVPNTTGDMVVVDDSTVIVIIEDGLRFYSDHYSEFDSPEASRFCKEHRGNFLSRYNDTLYVLTSEDSGLILFDLKGRIHGHFTKEDGLASNMIWDRAFKDADGDLWIPTDGGISHIEFNSPFSYYSQADGLDGELILSIKEFEGDHYIGTSNSLFRIRDGREIGLVEPIHNEGYRYISLDVIRNHLLISCFSGLWELRSGENKPRAIYKNNTCNAVSVNPDSAGFVAAGAPVSKWYRLTDHDNWIFKGDIHGYQGTDLDFNYNGDWGIWTSLTNSPSLIRIRATRRPPETIEDYEVVYYDTSKGVPIQSEYAHGSMVGEHRIVQRGETFLEYVPQTDSFHQIELVGPGEEGENKYLFKLYDEDDGSIWYRRALSRNFRYACTGIDTFREIDPLARMNTDILWEGYFETDPPLIWVFTEEGTLVRYEPSSELLLRKIRPVLIRRFVADDSLYYGGGFNLEDEYTLAHDRSKFEITYSLPHYAASDAKVYKYRLEGYENEWSDWTTESVREYMNLNTGLYRFEVFGRDSYGRYSDVASLSFRILPAWYQTVWAYCLYLLALVGLIYGVVRIRTHRILVNNVKLQERVDLQTAELTRTVEALNTEVDQRKVVEVERESQRRRLDAIFHGVNEGILSVDERGVIDHLNRTSLDILGIEESELAGRNYDDAAIPLPEAMVDGIRQCIEFGKPIHDFQVTHRRDHETLLLVVNISSLSSGEPGKNSVLLVFRDVTRLYQLEREIEERAPVGDMLGVSPAMIRVFNRIDELADTTATVLIQGETGTGKGMVAAALHQNSPRKDGPFVVVNCAALNENLLASELFGHAKGAFTGAINEREGRFQAAAGGTLFLDEIGDISPLMQASLLRVLEKGEYERVGETKVRITDARIITATNRDLKARIIDGRFREDLYYRLNVVTIYIPPLRERKDDIPVYVEHFFDRFRESLNRMCDSIAPETMEMLLASDWPGNVRALENAIRSAVISCNGSVLMPHHFPAEVTESNKNNSVAPEPSVNSSGAQRIISGSPNDGGNLLDRGYVLEALTESSWNVSRAARRLGISRQYLHRLINNYELKRPD